MSTVSFTVDDIEATLRRAELHLVPPGDRRRAAVLVPLIDLPDGLHLVFTERSSDLPSHGGQISFPGGTQEECDPDLRTTALREAHEEIGLVESDVRLLGRLSEFVTRTSLFHLTPFVGEVARSPYPWRLSGEEVTAVFEIPLDHFADASNRGLHAYQSGGETRTSPAFFWNDHVIWGATADILLEFLALLRAT